VTILVQKAPPLRDPIIEYTSEISYSLYLLHAKIAVIVYGYMQWNGWGGHMIVIATTFALAGSLYRRVERPMIEYGKRWRSTAAATAKRPPS
jgi:peptidoglycan/LPS O-acetylase OafA/YrhL